MSLLILHQHKFSVNVEGLFDLRVLSQRQAWNGTQLVCVIRWCWINHQTRIIVLHHTAAS